MDPVDPVVRDQPGQQGLAERLRARRHHRRMRRARARAPHRSASRFTTETP
jgi:hypothetical protein